MTIHEEYVAKLEDALWTAMVALSMKQQATHSKHPDPELSDVVERLKNMVYVEKAVAKRNKVLDRSTI